MTNAFSRPLRSNEPLGVKQNAQARHHAPIPLYPTSAPPLDTDGSMTLRLRRNPNQANAGTYEKSYHPFDGNTPEEYCRFRFMWQDIEEKMPLTNATMKFAQMGAMLSGQARTNWDLCVDSLDAANVNTDAGFVAAMEEFSLSYCEPTARQDQRRFMNKKLGLPSSVTASVMWARLRYMDSCLPFLPGTGDRFPADHLREIMAAMLPDDVTEYMQDHTYAWDDPAKTDREVIAHFDNLLKRGDRKKAKTKTVDKSRDPPHRRGTKINRGKSKKICAYCTKHFGKEFYGHVEADCRRKKKAAGDENHNIEEAHEAIEEDHEVSESDELSNIEHEFLENFSTDE